MAVNGQDIGLIFGMAGGGTLQGKTGSHIKEQLNTLIENLNSDAQVKQRKIKLSLDIAGTKKNFTEGIKQITDGLSGQKQFKIEVKNIDASSAIKQFKNDLEKMLNSLKIDTGFAVTIGENGATGAIKDIAKDAAEAQAALDSMNAKLKEIGITNKSIGSGYKKAQNALGVTDEDVARTELLRNKFVELETAVANLRAKGLGATQEDYDGVYRLQQENQVLIQQTLDRAGAEAELERAQLQRARNAEKSSQREMAAATDLTAMHRDAMNLQKRMASALNNFSNASGTPWYETIKSGKQEIDDMLSGVTELNRAKLNSLIDGFNQAEGAIRASGKATKTLVDTLSTNAKKFAAWLGPQQLIMRTLRLMEEMVGAVRDIDTAMTELRKVTDETDESYRRYLTDATVRAKQLGATVSDTVNASADFARLGYSLGDAAQLADAALVYKNVGDGINDISEASESVISTMRAFRIEAENAMLIVDKFNEVGNNFAISSKGVGDALLRSASALASANNSLDESIALVTAANSVVQDPDKVGTSLRTVSMYLRAAKTEAEEAGESTEGMAESVSALRSELLALTGQKVDIQLDSNTFKSTYQILKELSMVWDDLSDITQANILEKIGGKRNSNVVSALLTNFDTAESVLETAADAAGSALAENEKYLDSIEGKVSILKSTFETTSWNIINSELVKGVLDFGNAVLGVVNALAKVDALLPSIVAAYVTYKSFQAAQNSARLVAQEAAAVASLVDRLVVEKATNDSLIVSYQSLNAAQQQSVLTKLQDAVVSGQLTQAQYQAIAANLGLATATTTAKAATDGLNISIKSLLASNPIGWIIMAISLIPTLINLFGSLHKSNEELIQDAKELSDSFKQSYGETTSDLETLRGMTDEYEKLSQGVDDYGNNISLAASDYERYQEIVSTILGISPELISGYDKEGKAIANKNGLLQRSIDLMEQEQRLKVKEHLSDDNLRTIASGAIASIDEIDTTIPSTLSYSGVKIDENGNRKTGFINQIEKYIEQAIGVEYDNDYYDWNGGKAAYIKDNAQAIEDNMGEILNRAMSDFTDESGHWEGLSREKADDLEDYLRSITSKVIDASATMRQELQLVPQTLTSYYGLTDQEKDFLSQYINRIDIAADTTADDVLQMKEDIISFTNFLAGNQELKDTISLGFRVKSAKNEDGEAMTVKEYQDAVDDLMKQVNSFEPDVQIYLKDLFHITDDGELDGELQKAIDHAKGIIMSAEDELTVLGNQMKRDFEDGNVDLTARVRVENEDGTYSTVASEWLSENLGGQEVAIHYTPIVDGKFLDKDELTSYTAEFNGASGVWTITSDLLNPKNKGKNLYEVYHTGGIVGGGTVRENEQLALLQKGEPIISNGQKQTLFDLIDFMGMMRNKLTKADFTGIDLISSSRNRQMAELMSHAPSGGRVNIHFGDVTIYGGNDETVRKHQEISRQQANEVLKYLNVKK